LSESTTQMMKISGSASRFCPKKVEPEMMTEVLLFIR
jgi:hypothetical protein